jgi:uncharacterized membrane protein YqhA
VEYVASLPVFDPDGEATKAYSLYHVVADLLAIAEKSPASNNVVVPVLQTIDILMDADLLFPLAEFTAGYES